MTPIRSKYLIRVVGLLLAIFLVSKAGFIFAQDVDEIPPTINSNEPGSQPDPVQNEEGKKLELKEDPPKGNPAVERFFSRISEDLSWGGYLRNESAYRVVRPSAFDKILNILHLQGRYRINRTFSVTGRVRAYYDAVYDVESIDTISPRKGPSTILTDNLPRDQIAALTVENTRQVEYDRLHYGIELKELYVDASFKHADFRLGRQIVRWGVVEGARVTDEINPLDFAELILRDIDDRYIPLFMLKSDFYLGNNSFELILIPEVRGHEPAPPGTEWEQFRFLSNNVQPDDAWKDFPHNLKNTEIAAKYSHVFTGGEFSLSYFYTWDDFPASFRSISQIGFFGTAPTVDFNPRYGRLRIYGATFSKSFESLIFNAEMAYTNGKRFGARFQSLTSMLNDPTFGVLERDYVKYAVGIDFNLFGISLSPAGILQQILNYDDQIIQDRFDAIGALFARKELIRNLFGSQLLLLYFVNDHDWLIRPQVYYNVTERVRIDAGADIFEGKIARGDPPQPGEFHFIGFFDNNDRIYLHVTYSF